MINRRGAHIRRQLKKREAGAVNEEHILKLSCPDRPGIVSSVTTLLFYHGANILEAQQFDDAITGNFFMRVRFAIAQTAGEKINNQFGEVAQRFGMAWSLRPVESRYRVLMMVSKFDHCLGDLLYRRRIGELPMDVVGIISNHPREALNITQMQGIPYHFLPVNDATKAVQEAQVKAIITEVPPIWWS
jgi:formyltetrahydrofolate deformylase